MSKLDPRPINKKPAYSWEDLNIMLQRTFSDPTKDSLLIDVRQFKMTRDEIVSETEKQGYKVSAQGSYYLRFE